MNLQEINDAFSSAEIVTNGRSLFIIGAKPRGKDGDYSIVIEYTLSKIRNIYSWEKDQDEISKWKLKKDCKPTIIEDQKTDEFAISMTTVSSNNFMLLTNHGRVFYKDVIKDGEPWRELNLPDYKTFK